MNKLMLTLAISVLFACNDDDADITSLRTEVLRYHEVSPGNTESKPISFHHFIFEAEDKDFMIEDLFEIKHGFAYDQISQTSFKAIQESLEIDGVFSEELKPGKYFIAVLMSDIDDARYSYTTVNVYPNEQVNIKKIFDNCCPNGSYEAW